MQHIPCERHIPCSTSRATDRERGACRATTVREIDTVSKLPSLYLIAPVSPHFIAPHPPAAMPGPLRAVLFTQMQEDALRDRIHSVYDGWVRCVGHMDQWGLRQQMAMDGWMWEYCYYAEIPRRPICS